MNCQSLLSKPWNYERLEKLVEDRSEESLQLEFKGPGAAVRADVISKSISSMANSAGGTVIFGIQEGPVIPGEPQRALILEPINPKEVSKERFESLITGNIHPRLPEFVITPVGSPDGKGVFYVVEVSQSHTIHQAKGHKYYRRRNFTTDAMEDYEVREGMHRVLHPIIQARIKFKKATMKVNFVVTFDNVGQRAARHCLLELKVRNGLRINSRTLIVPFPDENSEQNDLEWSYSFRNSWDQFPLLPGQSKSECEALLGVTSRQNYSNSPNPVQLSLYADEMPAKKKEISSHELFSGETITI